MLYVIMLMYIKQGRKQKKKNSNEEGLCFPSACWFAGNIAPPFEFLKGMTFLKSEKRFFTM